MKSQLLIAFPVFVSPKKIVYFVLSLIPTILVLYIELFLDSLFLEPFILKIVLLIFSHSRTQFFYVILSFEFFLQIWWFWSFRRAIPCLKWSFNNQAAFKSEGLWFFCHRITFPIRCEAGKKRKECVEENTESSKTLVVEPHVIPNRGPYPYNQPKR